MPRSLVLGVNGQDGSYLAEDLLRRGHEVVGVGRGEESRYLTGGNGFIYCRHDLRDSEGLASLVARLAPDYAFHFAAVHGPSGFQYEPVWREMLSVNVAALHVLLEQARLHSPAMRIIYAGSSKVLPAPLRGIIDEETEKKATCLYSIGKMAARDLILQYRANHAIAATNLIFFNHESERRPPGFLVRLIATALAAALDDPAARSDIKTLDFRIDWSAADELMSLTADIAEQSDEAEFVMASGNTVLARDAVRDLFQSHGLDYTRHLNETLSGIEPGPEFRVSLDRLEKAIGKRPEKEFKTIINSIASELGGHLN